MSLDLHHIYLYIAVHCTCKTSLTVLQPAAIVIAKSKHLSFSLLVFTNTDSGDHSSQRKSY